MSSATVKTPRPVTNQQDPELQEGKNVNGEDMDGGEQESEWASNNCPDEKHQQNMPDGQIARELLMERKALIPAGPNHHNKVSHNITNPWLHYMSNSTMSQPNHESDRKDSTPEMQAVETDMLKN